MLIDRVGDTRLVERGDEALVRLVERTVLDQLQDADLVAGTRLPRSTGAAGGSLAVATAGQRSGGKKARSEGDKVPARNAQHGDQLRFLCTGPAIHQRDALSRESNARDILARPGHGGQSVNAVLTSGQYSGPKETPLAYRHPAT